jgi:hypothetical protein
MIKNWRSSRSKAVEPRTSEAFRAEVKEATTEMIQKESERFETNVEVAIAKFGQDTITVIENMRNEHQCTAFLLSQGCVRSFDNDSKGSLLRPSRRNGRSGGNYVQAAFPILLQLIVKVLENIREVVRESAPKE